MTPWGFVTCWFFGSLTSFNPLFIQGNALRLPFSLAISHACSQLSGLCLWFQQWWHIIPVLKHGIFQCKKQQKTKRGNVAMSKGFSTQYLQLRYKATQRLDEEWERKKKIWQWSDCSPSTSNPTISNPSMSCAGKGRHRLGLPQVAGNPKGKGEGTHCFQETKSPRQDRSHHDLSSPNKEGGRARRYSPVSFVQRTQSQQHGSVSCFLSNHLPTTRKTTEVCQESAIFWISK